MSELIVQVAFGAFIAFGSIVWLDVEQSIREIERELAHLGQRVEYAREIINEIGSEASALRKKQEKKASLKQAEARLSEATALLLAEKVAVEARAGGQ